MKPVITFASLHLFIIPLLLVALATPVEAGSCYPVGGIRNEEWGCCGLNNLKHTWEVCTPWGWEPAGGCDYYQCCAYPCGTPMLSSNLETNPTWFEAGGLLAGTSGDQCQGDHRGRTIEGSYSTAPTQESPRVERPALDLETAVEMTS